MTKAVFPAPLGPKTRNVGVAVDARDLYKYQCTNIGSVMEMRRVMRMVERYGPSPRVSHESCSYHVIVDGRGDVFVVCS